MNKLRRSIQSGIFPLGNRATINDKERVKERWAEYFEIVLNQDRVAGKYTKENEKVFDTLDVKEDLSGFATVLKESKNNKAPDGDRMANEFLGKG